MGAPALNRRPGGLSAAPWLAPTGALVPAPAVSALGPVSYTRFSQGRGCRQSGWYRGVYPLPVDAALHRRVSSGLARADAVLAIGEVADPSRPSFTMNPVGPGWDLGRDQGRWGRGFVPCGRAALLVGFAVGWSGGGPPEAVPLAGLGELLLWVATPAAAAALRCRRCRSLGPPLTVPLAGLWSSLRQRLRRALPCCALGVGCGVIRRT